MRNWVWVSFGGGSRGVLAGASVAPRLLFVSCTCQHLGSRRACADSGSERLKCVMGSGCVHRVAHDTEVTAEEMKIRRGGVPGYTCGTHRESAQGALGAIRSSQPRVDVDRRP